MLYQKFQGTVGLEVIPSDNTFVPNVSNQIVSSASTSVTANKLVDNTVDYVDLGIKEGNIIYNTTGQLATRVVAVDDANTLSLEDDIFTAIGENYVIYDNYSHEPCFLYVGQFGDVRVLLEGGGDVTLRNLNDGQFLPLYIKKVFSTGTTATNLVAIW